MKNEKHKAPSNASPNQHPPSPAKPSQPWSQPSMLTLKDLSERLQISRRQIYRAIDRGELPHPSHRLGRNVS